MTPSLTLTANRESVISDDLRAEEKVRALTQTWVKQIIITTATDPIHSRQKEKTKDFIQKIYRIINTTVKCIYIVKYTKYGHGIICWLKQ